MTIPGAALIQSLLGRTHAVIIPAAILLGRRSGGVLLVAGGTGLLGGGRSCHLVVVNILRVSTLVAGCPT